MSKNLSMIELAAAVAFSLLAGCVSVKPGSVVAPVAPTATKEDAARKLELVKVERARAEARFAAGEQLCYTKFFTNNCLDKVREEHRVALANVRAIEIEAEHFQRKTRADERDAALVESNKKFAAEQEKLRANPPPPPKTEQPAPPPRPPSKVDRSAEHAARIKRLETQEQAGAAQREANVKAFEARKLASEQRLKDVERKKAETAKAQADKAAAEKAAADKAAADKAAKAAAPAK
jgi:colicin import membrane protein